MTPRVGEPAVGLSPSLPRVRTATRDGRGDADIRPQRRRRDCGGRFVSSGRIYRALDVRVPQNKRLAARAARVAFRTQRRDSRVGRGRSQVWTRLVRDIDLEAGRGPGVTPDGR